MSFHKNKQFQTFAPYQTNKKMTVEQQIIDLLRKALEAKEQAKALQKQIREINKKIDKLLSNN